MAAQLLLPLRQPRLSRRHSWRCAHPTCAAPAACLPGYTGPKCDKCKAGYGDWPGEGKCHYLAEGYSGEGLPASLELADYPQLAVCCCAGVPAGGCHSSGRGWHSARDACQSTPASFLTPRPLLAAGSYCDWCSDYEYEFCSGCPEDYRGAIDAEKCTATTGIKSCTGCPTGKPLWDQKKLRCCEYAIAVGQAAAGYHAFDLLAALPWLHGSLGRIPATLTKRDALAARSCVRREEDVLRRCTRRRLHGEKPASAWKYPWGLACLGPVGQGAICEAS